MAGACGGAPPVHGAGHADRERPSGSSPDRLEGLLEGTVRLFGSAPIAGELTGLGVHAGEQIAADAAPVGSTSPRTALAAMAASIADPPRLSVSTATRVARGWLAAMPWRAWTSERVAKTRPVIRSPGRAAGAASAAVVRWVRERAWGGAGGAETLESERTGRRHSRPSPDLPASRRELRGAAEQLSRQARSDIESVPRVHDHGSGERPR